MHITSRVLGEKVSIEDLQNLQAENPDITVEKDTEGMLILASLSEYYLGAFIYELQYQIELWNNRYRLGRLMGAATGYHLPNNALRSPDISWVSTENLQQLPAPPLHTFPQLVPDFVIELRSPEDKVADLIRKMNEYQSCGLRLGWIIDPIDESLYIFRCKEKHEVRFGFDHELSGEDVLVNFSLNLRRLRNLR